MNKWIQKWASPPKVLLAGLCIGALAALVPAVVSAVAPAANSSIGNRAAATYVDASGQPRDTQSNEVTTLVAQVGKLTLTDDNIKSTAVGTTVYMPHTLTNLGNGSDTFTITVTDANQSGRSFSSIAIYPDFTGSNVPATPLCKTPGTNPCTGGFTQNLVANGSFRFVVAYEVPSSATAPLDPFDKGIVTATAGQGSFYQAPSVSNTDTVKTTTGAAFASTKALAAPAVAPASGGQWPVAVTSGKPSAASCGTTWPVTSSAQCTYTVFTIDYRNNGAAAAPYTMQDTIPAGMTFVKGSAVWSGAGGTALADGTTYASPSGVSGIKSSLVSNVFSAVVGSVLTNSNGTISFVVLINDKATVGKATTTNIAKYWTTACDVSLTATTDNCSGNPSVTSEVPFTITATFGVVASNPASTTPDTGTPPPATGNDLVTQPSVAPGGTVDFIEYITNTGNDNDIFTLSVDNTVLPANAPAGAANFPAGTEFRFYHLGGQVALLGNSTGPVIPGVGNAVGVVMKALVPAGTPANAGPFYALVTATSVNNGAQLPVVHDSIWNKVNTVTPTVQKVDLTNTAAGNHTVLDHIASAGCSPNLDCDLGAGPSNGPTETEGTTAGVGATFNLYVRNNDNADATYTLTAPNLPLGWNVKFVAHGGNCSSAAITQVQVATGAQSDVVACVTPPTGASPGTSNVFFKVTSTTDVGINDTITDAVRVDAPVIKSLTLTPSNSSNSIVAGGTVTQAATLGNNGNQNCGVTNGFNVTATVDTQNWSASVYFDKTPIGVLSTPPDVLLGAPGTVGAAGNLSTANVAGLVLPLAPAQNFPLLVKVFAPSQAINGATAIVTLTVTDAGSSACPTQTSKFTATVTNGKLSLLKLQNNQDRTANCAGTGLADVDFKADQLSVAPGGCLAYRVVATNDSGVALTKVDITDFAPSFTTFVTGTGSCTLVGGSGTASFSINTTNGNFDCSDASTATGITLNPGGTLTLRFEVKVQE